MNIKRYIAKDNYEALKKIKEEIGDDAVILHSRKIKEKGLIGYFKKPLVEVVVATDKNINIKAENVLEIENLDEKINAVKKESFFNGFFSKKNNNSLLEDNNFEKLLKEKNLDEDIQKEELLKEIYKNKQKYDEQSFENEDNEDIDKKNIKNFEKTIQNNVKYDKIKVEPNVKKEKKTLDSFNDELKEVYYKYYKRLIEKNVKLEYVEYIFSFILQKLPNNPTEKDFVDILEKYIQFKLGDIYDLDKDISDKKIFLFLGPTGVGKTTTLAKLSARISLLNQKKVGLITADTYRIAAIEQLKTYSEIIDIPISVAYNSGELKNNIEKYSDKDYILIDTAGHSHKSDIMKEDIIELINVDDKIEKFLVLSLVSSANDVVAIINSYKFLDDYRLVFTKLDETENIGNVLNARFASNKQIAFITNGQNVPDDIVITTKENIAKMLIGE